MGWGRVHAEILWICHNSRRGMVGTDDELQLNSWVSVPFTLFGGNFRGEPARLEVDRFMEWMVVYYYDMWEEV